jgi:ABC-type sugar transport system permease subunit
MLIHQGKKDINDIYRKRSAIQESIYGWFFISLGFVMFIVFRFIPIIFSFVFSFTKISVMQGLKGVVWTGLDNFRDLITDEWFHVAFINTFRYVLMYVPAVLAIALFLAIILNSMVYFKEVLRLLYYLPYISSVVAVSLIWMILYAPDFGPINNFLRALGVQNPPGWISSSRWALPSIAIMGIWSHVGYAMIIFLAGLQSIPGVYYEAAEIDGASKWRQFIVITIPLISPTMFFLMITTVIGAFQIFAQVNVMTQGGPGNSTQVLVYYIYTSAFTYNKLGYASAVAVILFVIVMAFTSLQWIGQKKWVHTDI